MFFEFPDTAVFPIVDGRDAHTQRHRCCLVTQTLTDDQRDRRLLIRRKPGHHFLQRPTIENLNGRLGWPVERTDSLRFLKFLNQHTTPPIPPIGVLDEVVRDLEKITRGNVDCFKPTVLQEPKKHFLGQVFSLFG